MIFSNILFDLDGTITDPKEGITKCVAYALESFGIHVSDLDTLTNYIGPPLLQGFEKNHDLSHEQAVEAVKKYRERYSFTGIFENKPYPGIDRLFKDLFESGKKIIVATSKPTVYSTRILDKFKLYDYVSFVAGSTLTNSRTDKAEIIQYAEEKTGIKPDESIMVGDRIFDIIGGKKRKMRTIGVTYGYGSIDEINGSAPDYIVDSVTALRNLLI